MSARLLLVLGVFLLTGSGAPAGSAERTRSTPNKGDQAAARAATVRRPDLRPAGGWVGGMVKPRVESASAPVCANYHPDVSHFVLVGVRRRTVTGAAASDWTRYPYGADLERSVSVQTEVLQTAKMLRREWRLQIDAPAFGPCFRRFLAKWYVRAGGKLLSLRRVSLPRVAPDSAAYRIVGKFEPLQPYVTEFALVGKGRTEIELSVFAASSAATWVAAETVRLARVLARRVTA